MQTTTYEKSITITDEMKQQYIEEGYFILERAMSDEQIADIREEASRFMQIQDDIHARQGRGERDINQVGLRYFINNKHQEWESSKLARYIYSELMAEVCRATLGDTAFLFNEQYVIKAGEKGSAFAWHQDSGYVGNPHKPYVTVWSTVDDVSEENGTVYILPYSVGGQPELVQHEWQADTDEYKGYFGDHPGIPVVAPAGSLAVFSSLTFHRSGRNTTPKPRRVYLTQYSVEPILGKDGTRPLHFAEPFLQAGKRIAVS